MCRFARPKQGITSEPIYASTRDAATVLAPNPLNRGAAALVVFSLWLYLKRIWTGGFSEALSALLGNRTAGLRWSR